MTSDDPVGKLLDDMRASHGLWDRFKELNLEAPLTLVFRGRHLVGVITPSDLL